MCLGQKLSDRSLARYKAKGKKTGYIIIFKTVNDRDGEFKPWYKNRFKYEDGLNCARKDADIEDHLIHAFQDKESAELYCTSEIVLECLVRPEWVKAIGGSDFCNGFVNTLTTKAIVMPAYPKRKVTVREFRAAIKGKKVKTYSWEQQRPLLTGTDAAGRIERKNENEMDDERLRCRASCKIRRSCSTVQYRALRPDVSGEREGIEESVGK